MLRKLRKFLGIKHNCSKEWRKYGIISDDDGDIVCMKSGFDYYDPDYFPNEHALFKTLGFDIKNHIICIHCNDYDKWYNNDTQFDEFVMYTK